MLDQIIGGFFKEKSENIRLLIILIGKKNKTENQPFLVGMFLLVDCQHTPPGSLEGPKNPNIQRLELVGDVSRETDKRNVVLPAGINGSRRQVGGEIVPYDQFFPHLPLESGQHDIIKPHLKVKPIKPPTFGAGVHISLVAPLTP